MDNLAEKGTITLGAPARCARHDITLPGHMRTSDITLENMFQPSYLTEIQIRLVSGYLRLRIPEKKRRNANWRDDNVRFSVERKYEVISVNKSPSLTQGEDKEVSGELNGNSPRFPKDGLPQLSEQGDNICQIKWYNDVCSRKTYTIKHWLKGAPEMWIGLHDQC